MTSRASVPEAARHALEAWTDEGPNPDYHRRKANELRHTWPMLARALDELADAAGRPKPGGLRRQTP